MDKALYDDMLQIKRGSGKVSEDDDELVEFDGVISDNTLDSYYTRMDPKVLRGYARDATVGVPILPEHSRDAQPIGRSISGSYNQKTKRVIAKFYIQDGLDVDAGYKNTRSYIKAMNKGTARGLSIGAKVTKMNCDTCNNEMKPDPWFGWMFPSCKKGHWPGKVLKDDKKKTIGRVTATIDEAELTEFSVVTSPANKNSVVIQKAQEAANRGTLTEDHLERLQLTYNIDRSDLDLSLGDNHMAVDKDLLKDDDQDQNKDQDQDGRPISTELADLRSDNERLKRELEEADSLIAEYEEKSGDRSDTIQEMKDQIKKLERAAEENTELKDDIKDQNQEINRLHERLENNRKNEEKAEQMDRLLETKRDDCLDAYCRANGIRANSETADRERQRLAKIESYNRLVARTNMYLDDFAEETSAVRERRKVNRNRNAEEEIRRYEF